MDVERPLRQEVIGLVRDIVAEAEALGLPRSSYTWHRRFAMGIDHSIDAARKRSEDTSAFSKLHRSAEMAHYWLCAQREKQGSTERARLLTEAWVIWSSLTG